MQYEPITGHAFQFQAGFHWHVEDLGPGHTHIKARKPYLNGKVEQPHAVLSEKTPYVVSQDTVQWRLNFLSTRCW